MRRPRPWQKNPMFVFAKPEMTDERILQEWSHMRDILGDQDARRRLVAAFKTSDNYLDKRLARLGWERTE